MFQVEIGLLDSIVPPRTSYPFRNDDLVLAMQQERVKPGMTTFVWIGHL